MDSYIDKSFYNKLIKTATDQLEREAVALARAKRLSFAQKDPFEFLSSFRQELTAVPVGERSTFLRRNAKALLIAIAYAPSDQSPRLLDAVRFIYQTLHGNVGARIGRLADDALMPHFEQALSATDTIQDFELDVVGYLDLLTPPTRQSFLQSHLSKIMEFTEYLLRDVSINSVRLVNVLRKSFAQLPENMAYLCRNYMADMVADLCDLATLRTKEAKVLLATQIQVVMEADSAWRPSAETQDYRSGTRLVVLFNECVSDDQALKPELWVLMALEGNGIFAAAHSPDRIMTFLSTQMHDDRLPTVEVFSQDITYLRDFRDQALAP